LPVVVTSTGVGTVGYLNKYPGGFGEQMVLQEPTLVAVPGDLPSEIAALTEPLAVAEHAVNKARLEGDEAALVLGCGPIGLATIIALKARGVGPIVAADFSPGRRALAERLCADIVINPANHSPYQSWFDVAAPADYDPRGVAALLGIGPQPRPCVIFECVGVPGMLTSIFASAPLRARVIVVGVCMKTDSFDPIIAITKELNLQFSYAYTLPEFTDTLRLLADGKLSAAALITDTIAPEQVPTAFDELRKADHQAKVIVKMA
jgi:threonine dehydrogenase-like Zn-dependent dehydrogenase